MAEGPGNAPPVPLEQVEWRVDGKIDGGGGVRVVCYLDVPIITGLLEQWVGPFGWRDSYQPVNDKTMWCTLALRDPQSGEWIPKTDLGKASNQEPEKGLVSDAFKRVAMRKWRVGANVFDLPTLRITRFRTYKNRQGEDVAILTDESHEEIKRQLVAQGHSEAAEKVRLGGAASSEPSEQPSPRPQPSPQAARGEVPPPRPEPAASGIGPSKPQLAKFFATMNEWGVDRDGINTVLSKYGVGSAKDLTRPQMNALLDLMDKEPDRVMAVAAGRS